MTVPPFERRMRFRKCPVCFVTRPTLPVQDSEDEHRICTHRFEGDECKGSLMVVKTARRGRDRVIKLDTKRKRGDLNRQHWMLIRGIITSALVWTPTEVLYRAYLDMPLAMPLKHMTKRAFLTHVHVAEELGMVEYMVISSGRKGLKGMVKACASP